MKDKDTNNLELLTEEIVNNKNRTIFNALLNAFNNKKPVLIDSESSAGMGKPDIIRDFGYNIAAENIRKPVLWETLKKEQKRHILRNAEKYFVIVDAHITQMELPDVTGLAYAFNDKDYLEYKVPQWSHLCITENAMGLISVDELDRGSEQMLNSILRVVTASPSKMVLIAVGNPNNITPTLLNRFEIIKF